MLMNDISCVEFVKCDSRTTKCEELLCSCHVANALKVNFEVVFKVINHHFVLLFNLIMRQQSIGCL